MFDIVTIGTVTHDTFLTSPLFRVLKDKEHLEKIGFKTGEAECFALGSKLDIERPVSTIGGGAFNTAVTFARQGLKTALCAKVGDDNFYEFIRSKTRLENIASFVSRDKKSGTESSFILLNQNGERTILVYHGASEFLQKKDVPFSKLNTRWVYISPGKISTQVMRGVVSFFKSRGTKIAINPSREYLNPKKEDVMFFLKNSDVVIMNKEEASYCTGVSYNDEKNIFKKLDSIVQGIVVMTDGPRGAVVSDGKNLYRAGIFKEKKILDRTGAGDAFGSGFIAGLIQKDDYHFALRLASANATSVVEHIGATDGILQKKDLKSSRWNNINLDVDEL